MGGPSSTSLGFQELVDVADRDRALATLDVDRARAVGALLLHAEDTAGAITHARIVSRSVGPDGAGVVAHAVVQRDYHRGREQ